MLGFSKDFEHKNSGHNYKVCINQLSYAIICIQQQQNPKPLIMTSWRNGKFSSLNQ